MTSKQFTICPQSPLDNDLAEQLLDRTFGMDRQTKSSYRLREGQTAIEGLSFIAKNAVDELIGTISFWNIYLGQAGTKAILLGPLAVEPNQQSTGVGLALMRHGIAAAKQAGHKLVILVGDAPYYGKVGFKQVPASSLYMPGANDPKRLLYLELEKGAFITPNGTKPSGLIRSPSRWDARP